MNRRKVITLLGGAAAWPVAARAQQGAHMKRIGIIVAGSAYPMDGFKSGLRNLGWVEGEGIRFDIREAEGQLHLLPQFASEMVSLGVDLIAVIGAVTVRAVRQVTSSIPTVFAVVVEPVGDGLAASLEHPGGNVTGVTTFDPQQATTQLRFLKAVNPGLEQVARRDRGEQRLVVGHSLALAGLEDLQRGGTALAFGPRSQPRPGGVDFRPVGAGDQVERLHLGHRGRH